MPTSAPTTAPSAAGLEQPALKTRRQIQKEIAGIHEFCRQFSEATHGPAPLVAVSPDVKRVSMLISLALELCGELRAGNGLEIGAGFGSLLFPMAAALPHIHWTAIEHPGREFVSKPEYRAAFDKFHCELILSDIVREPFPFPDDAFDVVTFSEVLEHLPAERLYPVLGEIARVTMTGGILIVSSPNLTSLENRIRLAKGKSILEMPDEMSYAAGTYGHIRLYATAEILQAMERLGFEKLRCEIESCNAGYRGKSERSLRRRAYRMYERVERLLPPLKRLGDTWYLALAKRPRSGESM